ncbi:MAG: crotonase/enoyl-CoA hydratase family protein [Gammaproteobacteria bacterium]|nr:crotonase/enoyl-CoA hydratase family protein [Gammaproteobacteria bacterium]
MAEVATYELIDHVAVVTMDDGKANVFGPDMIAALNSHLDRAAEEAKVVLLTGRPGLFSGGFDLRVIRGDDEDVARNMTRGGARLLMRLYGLPQPLVIASTGHAVALGALCLLTGDYRVGADGDFRIGLNETAIGLALPPFAVMLADERLSRRHLARATLGATIFSPEDAKDAGFLDEVVPLEKLRESALDVAREMVDLDGFAYAGTKQGLRGNAISGVLKGLGS